jgi:hypothetical protein
MSPAAPPGPPPRLASRPPRLAACPPRGLQLGPPVNVLLKILYWVAVFAVSLAILVGLVLLLESRDESDVEGGALPPAPGELA